MGEFLGAILTSIFQSMAMMFSKWFNEKIQNDSRLQLVMKIIVALLVVFAMLLLWQNGQNR